MVKKTFELNSDLIDKMLNPLKPSNMLSEEKVFYSPKYRTVNMHEKDYSVFRTVLGFKIPKRVEKNLFLLRLFKTGNMAFKAFLNKLDPLSKETEKIREDFLKLKKSFLKEEPKRFFEIETIKEEEYLNWRYAIEGFHNLSYSNIRTSMNMWVSPKKENLNAKGVLKMPVFESDLIATASHAYQGLIRPPMIKGFIEVLETKKIKDLKLDFLYGNLYYMKTKQEMSMQHLFRIKKEIKENEIADLEKEMQKHFIESVNKDLSKINDIINGEEKVVKLSLFNESNEKTAEISVFTNRLKLKILTEKESEKEFADLFASFYAKKLNDILKSEEKLKEMFNVEQYFSFITLI